MLVGLGYPSSPCIVDLVDRLVKTSWVWQPCPTHFTLNLADHQVYVLWTWLAPCPDTLGLANMLDPRYFSLGWHQAQALWV